jgi:hypothetical protein
MLIAAITIFLLGGGSNSLWLFPENFSKQIKKVVIEETRKNEILNAYEDIKKSSDSHNDEIRKIVKEISLLNQNPDATNTDYEKSIQEILQKRKQFQKEIVETRLKMASQLEPDEWTQIFKELETAKN